MSRAQRIAFVCPRFSEKGTVGGAETLLKALAEQAAEMGREVDFLTTCAESHFTWENVLPAGSRRIGKLNVHFFPVESRDTATFFRVQTAISNRGNFTEHDEELWIRNSVNSEALYQHLRENGNRYDRIVTGPYLFGVTYFASLIHPSKTLMVPCLHDEPFAYLSIMQKLFRSVSGFMFNAEPERDLARRLFNIDPARCTVVGLGMDPFEADPAAFAKRHKLTAPYVIFCGRRETGKGTPLLCDYMAAFRERTGRDVRVVFTGSGPIEAPASLEPFIMDLGFVSDREKHEAMAGAVAFIHPSVLESLGIVLLESWLARTPVLVHAKSEVLRWQCARSGGGLWFRGYPEFEEELTLLLDQPAVRARLGKAGEAYVRSEYAWTAVRKRMFDALDGAES